MGIYPNNLFAGLWSSLFRTSWQRWKSHTSRKSLNLGAVTIRPKGAALCWNWRVQDESCGALVKWMLDVLITLGSLHAYPDKHPIFPSDFVTYHCLDKQCSIIHLGRIAGTGLDYRDTVSSAEKGQLRLKVQRVLYLGTLQIFLLESERDINSFPMISSKHPYMNMYLNPISLRGSLTSIWTTWQETPVWILQPYRNHQKGLQFWLVGI